MKIKDRLAKLIEVKTIITLTMLGVFSYLAGVGKISAGSFLELFKVFSSEAINITKKRKAFFVRQRKYN